MNLTTFQVEQILQTDPRGGLPPNPTHLQGLICNRHSEEVFPLMGNSNSFTVVVMELNRDIFIYLPHSTQRYNTLNLIYRTLEILKPFQNTQLLHLGEKIEKDELLMAAVRSLHHHCERFSRFSLNLFVYPL